MTPIISRADAKAAGLTRYFTGKPCKHRHGAERQVSDGKCIECRLKVSRNRYAANRESEQAKWRERRRKLRHADLEKEREKQRERSRKHYQTPLGQLRALCHRTAQRLEIGRLNHSRLKLLGYGVDEFIAHLESTLPVGMTMKDAKAAGYHLDHVVPLAVLSAAIEDRTKAFQVAQDLENLRMVPGAENRSKRASLDLLTPEQATVFDRLMHKHEVYDELLPVAVPW